MREEFNHLYIYEDGTVIYSEDRGLRMPTRENPPIRTWKKGQLQEEELNSLLEFFRDSRFGELDEYYEFPGMPNEGGGFTMGDMGYTILCYYGDLHKKVSAFGYLTPDHGMTYPDMPYPLRSMRYTKSSNTLLKTGQRKLHASPSLRGEFMMLKRQLRLLAIPLLAASLLVGSVVGCEQPPSPPKLPPKPAVGIMVPSNVTEAGSSFMVTGRALKPGERVWAAVKFGKSAGVQVHDEADENGFVYLGIMVPEDVAPGEYEVKIYIGENLENRHLFTKLPIRVEARTRVDRSAVVRVEAELKGGRWSRNSGFIITSGGTILTLLSKPNELERLEVTLSDGRTFPGRVDKIDDATGVAYIEIEATGLSTVTLGVRDVLQGLKAGEQVFVAGYSAKGYEEIATEILDPDYLLPGPPGVTTPVVKLNTGVSGESTSDIMEKFAGMAGGPVVNAAGRVLGIMLAVDPNTGESFMVTLDRWN